MVELLDLISTEDVGEVGQETRVGLVAFLPAPNRLRVRGMPALSHCVGDDLAGPLTSEFADPFGRDGVHLHAGEYAMA